MEGDEGGLSQLVEDGNADAEQASYNDVYIDFPVRGSNQTGSNVDRASIVHEFLLHVGLSESSLLGIYQRCVATRLVNWDCRYVCFG